MVERRVLFGISSCLLILPGLALAGQQAPGSQNEPTPQIDLRTMCGVGAAEGSGDLAKMNAALACINLEKERQRKIEELRRTIEKSLGSRNQSGNVSAAPLAPPVSPPSPPAPAPANNAPQPAIKPNVAPVSGSGNPAPAVPLNGATAGQVILDSAYNTPTACDSSSQAAGGDSNGVIAVHRNLLVPKEASDDFGYRLGRRFIVYKVSVTNTSSTLQYSIADISVDLKGILTAMGAVPDPTTGKYPRFLASGHDLSLLRGIPEKGQDYDPRNMTIHILQGIGSTAGAVSGLTPFSDVMGPATADFNGAFLQALIGIAPDHAATQLNRLSDMAFSPNNLIDKNQTKTYAVFIPESLLLEKSDQNVFWKDPRRLLNIYPFDQVDVCVAGQLLTPAATTAPPSFTPDAGNISPTTTIILTATSADAIYYTTDGTIPTTNSSKYTKPFAVNTAVGATTTVQAFATAANQVQSPIVSKSYTTQPQASTPTFNPVAGAVAANTSVAIATTTPGATIYFTTDGTEPTLKSTSYTGAISVSPPETVNAIAISPATSVSNVGNAQYTATQ